MERCLLGAAPLVTAGRGGSPAAVSQASKAEQTNRGHSEAAAGRAAAVAGSGVQSPITSPFVRTPGTSASRLSGRGAGSTSQIATAPRA